MKATNSLFTHLKLKGLKLTKSHVNNYNITDIGEIIL